MHDTLQLNGIAEHLNCTLLERIHAFTHSSGLPKSLWGEVLWHVTWLKNQTATHALDSKMPFKALCNWPGGMVKHCTPVSSRTGCDVIVEHPYV